jgi:KDO2-lipid IV(A) lauroyltransferase
MRRSASAGAEAAPLPHRHRPLVVRRLRRALRQSRDTLLAVTTVVLFAVLRVLPLRPAVAVTGALVGAIAPWLGKSWRLATAHLELALPELPAERRRAIARAAFANLGRSFVEVAKLATIRAMRERYVSVEGVEHMHAALAEGNGALAITGHVGNWELLAAACAAIGLPVDVIGRRPHNAALNHLLVAMRARSGVTTIERDSPHAGRAILRTLRANRILALLIDQDTRGPRVFGPFFRRPAATPSGVAALALRTQARVVAVFIHRRSEGGHLIRFLPPFPAADADRDDVQSLTNAYTAAIEAQIRAYPEEWVWWHRRWRRRPLASDAPSPIP